MPLTLDNPPCRVMIMRDEGDSSLLRPKLNLEGGTGPEEGVQLAVCSSAAATAGLHGDDDTGGAASSSSAQVDEADGLVASETEEEEEEGAVVVWAALELTGSLP